MSRKVNIRTRQVLAGAFLAALCGLGSPAGAAEEPGATSKCAPSGELSFLCGMGQPEDLAPLPGDRWIVGSASIAGLLLVDTKAKTWERWTAPVTHKPQPPYQGCAVQLTADESSTLGISVRMRQGGRGTLYVSNRGSRGSPAVVDTRIDIFDIDMAGAKPSLTWTGCVPMPDELSANSVTSTPDGSIFATVMLHAGFTVPDLWRKKPTGAVYKWTPGSAGFERLAGTDLTGNNGIEASRDGKVLYVASMDGPEITDSAITTFTTTNPARRLDRVVIKGGLVDNIHWIGGRLIQAGPRADLCPPAGGAPCTEGYQVQIIDPDTLALQPLAMGPANPAFTGASVGAPVGDMLWIGSFATDKIAYRRLP